MPRGWLLFGLIGWVGCAAPTPDPTPPREAPPAAAPASEGAELLVRADKTFKARNYAAARAEYERCARVAAQEHDVSTEVEALSQVARCYSLAPDLKQASAWLAKAEAKASVDHPYGWTRYLGVRGILERERGDKQAATRTFQAMHAYAEEKKLWRRAIDAVHHLAIVLPRQQQIAWAKKGIRAAEQLESVGWLAVLWNNLGVTYEELKRYPECLDAYRRARRYHRQGTSEQAKLTADWAVGHAYRLIGDLDRATELLARTLRWAVRRYAESPGKETGEWIGWCERDLGEVDLARGQPVAALKRLTTARKHLVEAGIETWWPASLKQLDASIKRARGGE